MNPGEQWAKWPYGHSALLGSSTLRGKFNHNYMERYWPKLPACSQYPTTRSADWHQKFEEEQHALCRYDHARNDGIMYEYGDLADVVKLLANDPPPDRLIFPCGSLRIRAVAASARRALLGTTSLCGTESLMSTTISDPATSSRHFRDDIYLTTRLLLWVIKRMSKA
jgi:hypothetical protein